MTQSTAVSSSAQRLAPSALVTEDKYKYKYLIAIAVTLAAVLELIDTSIVNVAIPHMMGNLGATLDEISWVSTGYIIANVIVIPMSGWLSAYFGRKRYLTGSIVLFIVSSFFCGAATSLGGLVFWRVVQGIGGGALLSTAQATLFEAFPPKEVGIGQAMFGVGVMVGPTLGPTLGGYIVDNYNWPWIFYINVPLGIIAAIMVATYVHDAEHQERADTVDVLGFVLLAVCVGSLQFMLEKGERYDWFESRLVTWLGITSAVSFVLLIWRELTVKEPIINFRVLKSRQLAAGVSIAAVLGLALFGSIFILPIFLQNLHGLTANQTGMVILPGAGVGVHDGVRRQKREPPRRSCDRHDRCDVVLRLHVAAGAHDAGERPGRDVLAVDHSRRRTGVDLRAAHERLDGGAEGHGARTGHRHVQSHAAARRFVGHRDHGDAAHALHR
jgi:DHA2 family multidrug resistance protein